MLCYNLIKLVPALVRKKTTCHCLKKQTNRHIMPIGYPKDPLTNSPSYFNVKYWTLPTVFCSVSDKHEKENAEMYSSDTLLCDASDQTAVLLLRLRNRNTLQARWPAEVVIKLEVWKRGSRFPKKPTEITRCAEVKTKHYVLSSLAVPSAQLGFELRLEVSAAGKGTLSQLQ